MFSPLHGCLSVLFCPYFLRAFPPPCVHVNLITLTPDRSAFSLHFWDKESSMDRSVLFPQHTAEWQSGAVTLLVTWPYSPRDLGTSGRYLGGGVNHPSLSRGYPHKMLLRATLAQDAEGPKGPTDSTDGDGDDTVACTALCCVPHAAVVVSSLHACQPLACTQETGFSHMHATLESHPRPWEYQARASPFLWLSGVPRAPSLLFGLIPAMGPRSSRVYQHPIWSRRPLPSLSQTLPITIWQHERCYYAVHQPPSSDSASYLCLPDAQMDPVQES